MPEMIESINQPGKRAHLLHEISFSLYFSLLLIMANAVRSVQHPTENSWVDGMQSLIARAWYAPPHHFAFGILWAMSAAVLLLCLRIAARLSFSDVFLRTFGGIVAVAGFPLAAGYVSFRGYLNMLGSVPRALAHSYAPYRWLAVEVMASLLCIFVYVFAKWPTKARWSLTLLCLHFAVWTWFVFTGGDKSLLVYPLLGFLASLVWGSYVRLADQIGDGRDVF